MIHFVNLNATWDTVMLLDELGLDQVNKAVSSFSYPGGKGNNAARTVALLGSKVQLFSFCGKAQLGAARNFYRKAKVDAKLQAVEGASRPCLILLDAARDQESVINTPSQLLLKKSHLLTLRRALLRSLRPGDLVGLSGSIPEGLPADTYQSMIHEIQAVGAIALLDAHGPALKNGVEAAPLIVKPNLEELGSTFGWPLRNRSEILQAAERLLKKGVRAVVVTLGARGALVRTAKEALLVSPLPQARGWHSPVGCGDAFFGTLAWSLAKNMDYRDGLRYATAAAWANLQMPGAIFFEKRLVKAQAEKVKITRIV